MKRRLLNLAAGVSAVLCVGFVALWVRSHFVLDSLRWAGTDSYTMLFLPIGSLAAIREDGVMQPGPPTSLGAFHHGMSSPRHLLPTVRYGMSVWEIVGFAYGRPPRNLYHFHFIQVPLWFPALIAAILPAMRFRRYRQEKAIAQRQRMNQCPKCGYDLRATPDRCPECGSVPSTVSRVAQSP